VRTAAFLGMALWLGAVAIVTPPPAIAQQGPIRLFPQFPPAAPSAVPIAPQPAPAQPLVPPAGPDQVVVEGLVPPALDSIGLMGPGGGFDRALWQGSDPATLLALLSDLPVVTTLPPLRRLLRRLLVTGSPVAAGDPPGQLLAVRLRRLLAMGDLDAAAALAAQVPPQTGDSEVARAVAEVALVRGDPDAACPMAEAIGLTTTAEFWSKVAIWCRLARGDLAGARLGLDLMREAAQTDDAGFFALVTALADQAGSPPVAELRPGEMAAAGNRARCRAAVRARRHRPPAGVGRGRAAGRGRTGVSRRRGDGR
jgi:hypothetical protein